MLANPQLKVRIRILQNQEIAIGPGKVDLLEAIATTGSISKAAKQMGMSYRRAWQLVDTMNHSFKSPVVMTQTGGNQGGGAIVSSLGYEVIKLFREMEQKAQQAVQNETSQLIKLMKEQ